MGTLDDAIREHLELKKRSGASEAEVKRLESEAFGPVRREPAPPAAVGPEDADPGLDDQRDAPGAVAASRFESQPDPPAPADVPPVPMDPFLAMPDPVRPTPPVAPPAVPEAPPPPRPDGPPRTGAEPRSNRSWLDDEMDEPPSQSTSEFTAAEATEAAGRPPSDYVAPDDEGEDLLEETPDFLQETPEHDRLWFEQRPPRDFDFDE